MPKDVILEKYNRSLQDFVVLSDALRQEVLYLSHSSSESQEKGLKIADLSKLSPIDRRLLVRSIFAFIEGIVYRIKQIALASPDSSHLTPAERAIAAEEDYELDSRGEVFIRPSRIKFLANIRFALMLYPKAEGVSFKVDFSGSGWEALQKAAKVRDRITHPKVLSDLMISDDEIHDAVYGFEWINRQITKLLAIVLLDVRNRVKVLQGEREKADNELRSQRERLKKMHHSIPPSTKADLV